MIGLRRAATVLLASLVLGGCATLSDTDRDFLAAHHVSPTVYLRMSRGEQLELADFVELSRRRIPTPFVLRYVRSRAAVYRLTSEDVLYLRRGGVDRVIIDYLLQTPATYAAFYADPFWYGSDPLWWDYGPVGWRGAHFSHDHHGGHGHHH